LLDSLLNTAVGSVVVKAEDLSPIMTALTDNAAVIVPFGIGIVAVFAGIKFIPKLIKTFARG